MPHHFPRKFATFIKLFYSPKRNLDVISKIAYRLSSHVFWLGTPKNPDIKNSRLCFSHPVAHKNLPLPTPRWTKKAKPRGGGGSVGG